MQGSGERASCPGIRRRYRTAWIFPRIRNRVRAQIHLSALKADFIEPWEGVSEVLVTASELWLQKFIQAGIEGGVDGDEKYDPRAELWTWFSRIVQRKQADGDCEKRIGQGTSCSEREGVRPEPQMCCRRDDVDSRLFRLSAKLFRLSACLISGDWETTTLIVGVDHEFAKGMQKHM